MIGTLDSVRMADCETIELWQVEVENDQIGRCLDPAIQGSKTIVGADDLEALAAQGEGYYIRQREIILNN
jgi:hypothetical protein